MHSFWSISDFSHHPAVAHNPNLFCSNHFYWVQCLTQIIKIFKIFMLHMPKPVLSNAYTYPSHQADRQHDCLYNHILQGYQPPQCQLWVYNYDPPTSPQSLLLPYFLLPSFPLYCRATSLNGLITSQRAHIASRRLQEKVWGDSNAAGVRQSPSHQHGRSPKFCHFNLKNASTFRWKCIFSRTQ